MNPECCGLEMQEKESPFANELGEHDVAGYECLVCGKIINLCGKEIG